MKPKPRWDTQPYQRMVSAAYRTGELWVKFENGDCVSVPVARLSGTSAHHPNWDAVTATPYEIVLPTANDEVEIPWLTIRLLTDNEFEAYWAKAAEQVRRRTGGRLREMREQRQLSLEQVATKANIPVELLVRIERGDAETHPTEIDRVLEAMGSSFREFALMARAPRGPQPRARAARNSSSPRISSARPTGTPRRSSPAAR